MSKVRRKRLVDLLLGGSTFRHLMGGGESDPLFQSHNIQSLPESPTLAHPGGAYGKFRLGAASWLLFRSEFNRTGIPGVKKTGQVNPQGEVHQRSQL